jgi:hypothetical protein
MKGSATTKVDEPGGEAPNQGQDEIGIGSRSPAHFASMAARRASSPRGCVAFSALSVAAWLRDWLRRAASSRDSGATECNRLDSGA